MLKRQQYETNIVSIMNNIAYYFDEMMSRIVAKALELKGITVVMAIDAGMMNKADDTEHLPYANENNFVLVTMDFPFAGRTAKHSEHGGLICWTGNQNDFGAQIDVLTEFAASNDLDTVRGQVFWLR